MKSASISLLVISLLLSVTSVAFSQELSDIPNKVKKNVKVEHDEMYELTKVTSKLKTRYKAIYWNKLTLVEKDDSYYVVLLTKRDISVKYGDWLFLDEIVIKTDKKVYRFEYDQLDTEVGDYNLEERAYKIFYPFSNKDHKDFLDDFLSSKRVKIRYSGKSKYKDVKGNERNLRSMRPVYRVLQYLMRELPSDFK